MDAGRSQVSNPLRLPGQYLDDETGLHYNDRRYYDPDTGRYLSRDPLGLAGGTNLYAYAGHAPTTRMDPTGEIVPCLAVNFARCMITCVAVGVGTNLVLDPCHNPEWAEVAKDCGLECLLNLLPIPNPCGTFGKWLSAGVGLAGGLLEGFNSFPGETPVHIKGPDGRPTTKAIAEIREGDEVLAWSEWKSGPAAFSYEPVKGLIKSHKEQTLVHLSLAGGGQLSATDGHPLYTPDGWRDAILLKKGGQLLLKGEGDANQWATIEAIHHERKTLPVYNLEVANAHTFFVGEEGVAVHNGRCTPAMRKAWSRLHNEPWPKNPLTEKIRPGGNRDGHHITPVSKGGHPIDPTNITPMTPSEHIDWHKKNGYR